MKTGWIWLVLGLTLGIIGLSKAAITVQSPNGGERISAGSQWLITWRCDARITQVAVEFSFTEGVAWETVASAVTSNGGKGSLLWTAPAISSARCLIRIRDAGNPNDADLSDKTFTIFPCALRMDYDGDSHLTDLLVKREQRLRVNGVLGGRRDD